MKFFDPKKKDDPTPNPIGSMPKPSNVQNSAPVHNPKVAPSPPAAPAPTPERVKAEPVKTEPVRTETVKPEPIKLEVPEAAPTVNMPAPELPKTAPVSKPTGKTLIGKSVIIRGDITSEENLQIEGVVDGSIETSNDVLVGSEGRVNATIRAGNIVIQGRVIGDVSATNRVELAP
ncbi:MAG TPA: polymer-forming cytoskeletal protein, partial [Thermoanaerobaculia bacterium]|nr:polymer-forming cytoskeletal protein [Thermoanaerobaculia bacterium]